MNSDMGVRKRYCVDLTSQQLQQTHRKCHHRQSRIQNKAAIKTKPQQTQSAIATTKLKEQQIKNVQYPPNQQYLINKYEQQRKQQQKLFQIQSGQQQQHQQHFIGFTTKHKIILDTTNITADTKPNSIALTPTNFRLFEFPRNSINSKRFSLGRLWTVLFLSLTCLTTWRVPAVNSLYYTHTTLWLPSVASMASLALTQSTLVAAAAAYDPPIKYHHSINDVEESDGMVVEDIDVNSNEQQLLAYYKKAQKEHEQLKRQQQQEQQLQIQQQRHHHQERDIKRNTVVLSQQEQEQQLQQEQQEQMNFNDILPTSDVISTLDTLETTSKKKTTATKRSTTKHTPPFPAATSVPNSLAITASITTTTTASIEEKCEPKVLDEIPAEPVSSKYLYIFFFHILFKRKKLKL